MKKKFFAIFITIIILSTTLLSGCSSAVVLSFNNNFYNAQSSPSVNYKEQAVYKVEHDLTNYHKKDSAIQDEKLPEFSNGTFKTTLEVLTGKPDNLQVDSEIFSELQIEGGPKLYSYTTEFSINVSWKDKEGQPHTDVDTDEKTIYFLSNGSSFAPIYTETKNNYTRFFYNNGEIELTDKVFFEGQTIYSKTKFTTISKVKLDDGEWQQKSNTADYTYKTVIDNAQLLFAIRNIDIQQEQAIQIPVVSYQYAEAKNLIFANNGENKIEDISINYNNINSTNTYTEITVAQYSFGINSINAAGAKQILYVQKAQENAGQNALPYKSLLYRYVAPVIEYGAFSSLGSLVYTLESVTIS